MNDTSIIRDKKRQKKMNNAIYYEISSTKISTNEI